jgi:hypothetical protein
MSNVFLYPCYSLYAIFYPAEDRLIDAALSLIAQQLNMALRRRYRIDDDLVVLSNIHELDGNVAAHIADKLVVSLVNVERETVTMQRDFREVGSRNAAMQPPVCLNLLVMFSANFSSGNYAEALKILSSCITFFQSRPVLDRANTPDLDTRIDKLTLEIRNVDITELSNLWGILSGRYLPSVLYKVRLLVLDAGVIDHEVPTILEPRATSYA